MDNILKEVADLELTDANTIKVELLERVKPCNYVPPTQRVNILPLC
ncbi:MAG: hypothetical protein ACLFVK_08455 [Dehalococcoidia bacterium]